MYVLDFKAMFFSWKIVSGKPLSKLFCVCLLLEKLVNEKHFPVNENTFRSKKNLVWFSGKCFPEKFGRKTLSGSYEKFRNVIIC
jgi:hypothetical protein